MVVRSVLFGWLDGQSEWAGFAGIIDQSTSRVCLKFSPADWWSCLHGPLHAVSWRQTLTRFRRVVDK